MSFRNPALVLACIASALSLGVVASACSSSSSGGTATDSGPFDVAVSDASQEATAPDTGTDAGLDANDQGGTATISGTVNGASFGNIVSVFSIGAPDLGNTTALYIVADPGVACSAMKSGWSHMIPTGVQIFEMILTTASPAAGTYTVSTATSPPAGSAEVNYIVSDPLRNETRAATGTVTLGTLTPGGRAIGSFDVQFPAGDGGAGGSLTGTFDTIYCAVGHEP